MRLLKVLALVLVLLVWCSLPVLAQDEGPPALEDPTDLMQVLVWLASGGAGAFVAVFIEKQKWFQKFNAFGKQALVLLGVVLVALIPQLLIDLVPMNVWDTVGPYFATVITAVLLGYPVSQLMHKTVNK